VILYFLLYKCVYIIYHHVHTPLKYVLYYTMICLIKLFCQAPLRMMLCYRNVNFVNKTYRLNEEFDRSVWLADAKPSILEKNALANLPYIIDGEMSL
jgi:hypothetical protein